MIYEKMSCLLFVDCLAGSNRKPFIELGHPVNQTVLPEQSATFHCPIVNGTEGVNIQWFRVNEPNEDESNRPPNATILQVR